jgi:CheY-like chemotaxis protein
VRILIAEDQAAAARVLRMGLERAGHSVEIVHDGRSAVERLGTDAFDLLVTDVQMPGLSGVDLCRMLGRRAEAEALEIVVMTSSLEDAERDWRELHPRIAFMGKPISVRRLLAHIETLEHGSKGGEGTE